MAVTQGQSKYCNGCPGCFAGRDPLINKDGDCPCSNCLIKVICQVECYEIKWGVHVEEELKKEESNEQLL